MHLQIMNAMKRDIIDHSGSLHVIGLLMIWNRRHAENESQSNETVRHQHDIPGAVEPWRL